METTNFNFLKNFGISNDIFKLPIDKPEVYIIVQEKMKKNFSEGAIFNITGSIIENSNFNSKDDIDIYGDCDHEYSVLKDPYEINFNNKFLGNNFSFSSEISKNKNTDLQETINRGRFKSNEEDDKQNFHNNRTAEIFGSNEESFSFKQTDEKTPKNEKLEKNQTNFHTFNSLKEENSNELKNGIFINSMKNQIDQLNRIFQEMNESKEAKVIIKAYRSKLKTKFYKIYESNSEFYKEKNKFKIFHKCNFPGCSRTFASAGWLKSHFNDHLGEIKMNKFNIEFERSLLKCQHFNLLQ